MGDNDIRDVLTDEDVRAVATAWMLLSWTAEGVAIAESQSCADSCEHTGTGWDCTDEEGDSRHPEADALAEACEMANLAIETLTGRGWRPPPRVIETDEEFDALPIGTLLVDQWGSAWQRGYEEVVGRQTWDAPDRRVLPATVLWTPEGGRDA